MQTLTSDSSDLKTILDFAELTLKTHKNSNQQGTGVSEMTPVTIDSMDYSFEVDKQQWTGANAGIEIKSNNEQSSLASSPKSLLTGCQTLQNEAIIHSLTQIKLFVDTLQRQVLFTAIANKRAASER